MTLRRDGRTIVIQSPLAPKDARARIRQELVGDSLGLLVAVEPGPHVVGWVQADGFQVRWVRRVSSSRHPHAIVRPPIRLRGTIEAEGDGCRLEGRFDPTILRTPRWRRAQQELVAWLEKILVARPEPPADDAGSGRF